MPQKEGENQNNNEYKQKLRVGLINMRNWLQGSEIAVDVAINILQKHYFEKLHWEPSL